MPTLQPIPVYRPGDVAPFFMVEQSDRHGPIRWWEKQIVIGYYFAADPDDVGLVEDDDGAKLITVCGVVVARFGTHAPMEG